MNSIKLIISALGLCLIAGLIHAQNSVQSGDTTVYYSAMPTMLLTPEVAKQMGIIRSENRVLLNIAARRGEAGSSESVNATMIVAATNLNGQRQTVVMREVREQDAVYYLGEIRINPPETLDIEADITTSDGDVLRVRFRQEFCGSKPC